MMDNKKIRIILDVSSLINHGQDIGAGRYILNLVKGLLSLEDRNSYILYGTYTDGRYLPLAYDLKKVFGEADISFKFIKAGTGILKIYERLRFPPLEFFGLKADVVHAMDYRVPPTLNPNIVLTIHDLAFMRFPDSNFEWFIRKYSRMAKGNASIASKILASSVSTAQDILQYLHVDDRKVEAVHLAADPVFRKLAPNEIDCTVPACFNISGPFLLSVGTIEPRKDFVTLIEAYGKARHMDPGFTHRLVIAGRTGWKSEATYEARERSHYAGDITFTGRLTDRELVQLYNQADLFVFTSMFEGFGLTPLEAMGCGLPVICSDSSSISEVVNGAGILVRPGHVEAFTAQILKLVHDKDLRMKLSRRSLKRSGQFSWQKTAEKTLAVYREAAGFRQD